MSNHLNIPPPPSLNRYRPVEHAADPHGHCALPMDPPKSPHSRSPQTQKQGQRSQAYANDLGPLQRRISSATQRWQCKRGALPEQPDTARPWEKGRARPNAVVIAAFGRCRSLAPYREQPRRRSVSSNKSLNRTSWQRPTHIHRAIPSVAHGGCTEMVSCLRKIQVYMSPRRAAT